MLLFIAPALAAPGDFVEDDARALWIAEEAGGTFGWVAEPVEDLDGDGVADVVTGAPFLGGGVVVVLSGATGKEVFRWASPIQGAQLGYDVSPAGDVDADGTPDVVGSGPASGPGWVWVLSGATGRPVLDLKGETEGDRFGDAVCEVGDLDGDGHADVAVGASGLAGAGRVIVASGAGGAALLVLDGEAGSRFGTALASIADFDGDGLRDLIVGAADGGARRAGQVTVWSTGSGRRLAGPFEPGDTGVDLGLWFVGDPGDLDQDGVPDVFAGDFAGARGSGLAFVFSGADGSVIHRWEGADQEGLGVGREAGDVDGDGIGDLAIGSWLHGRGGPGAGRVSVLSGLDGEPIHRWTSREDGENLGFDAVGFGDVDGDGQPDILATAATGNRVYALAWRPPESEDPADTDLDDTAPPDTADTGGCGCTSARGPGPAATLLWALLALVWGGRGRRRTAEWGQRSSLQSGQ